MDLTKIGKPFWELDDTTHPAGTADLVKRLRNAAGVDQMEYPYPMCNEAADRIEQLVATVEQLEAALTPVNAATAAAYEVAAREAEEFDFAFAFQCAPSIRALATPDQTAALDKLIAEAVKPYVEANGILEDALQEVGDDYPGSNCQSWCQQQVKEARAILAASKKGGV